jgi:hypothetical protein
MATKTHKKHKREHFVYVPFVLSCGPSLETMALTSGGTARPFESSSGGAVLDLIWPQSPAGPLTAAGDFFTNGNGSRPSDLR